MIQFEIVQDGETLIGVHDEVDLDTGADPHGFEDARRREFGIGRLAPGPVPLEKGPVTIAFDENGISVHPWPGRV